MEGGEGGAGVVAYLGAGEERRRVRRAVRERCAPRGARAPLPAPGRIGLRETRLHAHALLVGGRELSKRETKKPYFSFFLPVTAPPPDCPPLCVRTLTHLAKFDARHKP